MTSLSNGLVKGGAGVGGAGDVAEGSYCEFLLLYVFFFFDVFWDPLKPCFMFLFLVISSFHLLSLGYSYGCAPSLKLVFCQV